MVQLSIEKALTIHEKVISLKLAQNIGDRYINNKLVVLQKTGPMDLVILVGSKAIIVLLKTIIMVGRMDKRETKVKV